MMWNSFSGMGWGGGGFGWLFMILFWGLLIWVVFALIKGNIIHGCGHGNGGEKTAVDILKERYAKGEIDKEEFDLKKKDLEM